MRAVDLVDPVVAALGLEPQQALQVPHIIHLPAARRYARGGLLLAVNQCAKACATDLTKCDEVYHR